MSNGVVRSLQEKIREANKKKKKNRANSRGGGLSMCDGFSEVLRERGSYRKKNELEKKFEKKLREKNGAFSSMML